MSEDKDSEMQEVYQEMLRRLKCPLYNIGDHVVLDSNVTGHVSAVMSSWWHSTYIRPNGDYSIWFDRDKNWEQKNVYAILFAEPVRYVSLEEYQDAHPEIKEEHLVEKYEQDIRPTRMMMVPEIMIMGGV